MASESEHPATEPRQGHSALRIAAGLSALWVLLALLLIWLAPAGAMSTLGTLGWAMAVLALVLPVSMIWLAAGAAQATARMRAEQQRMHATLTALDHRLSTTSAAQTGHDTPQDQAAASAAIDQGLAEMRQLSHRAEAALTRLELASSHPAPQTPDVAPPSVPSSAPPAPEEAAAAQSSLPLVPTAEDMAPPLESADMIRALNFPDTADDHDGFAALRRALKDRNAAQLIQASQDVLTLLSQDGIYMDDLAPDRAKPELWRRFAQGERGGALSALGGIRDRQSLGIISARMRQDTIFRDAAHHFLRKYDQMLVRFEPDASDAEIAALAATRTSCAFMLLGRVTGTFD